MSSSLVILYSHAIRVSLSSPRFVLAVLLSRAVVASIVSILVYIVTFLPFVFLLVRTDQAELWHYVISVSTIADNTIVIGTIETRAIFSCSFILSI